MYMPLPSRFSGHSILVMPSSNDAMRSVDRAGPLELADRVVEQVRGGRPEADQRRRAGVAAAAAPASRTRRARR